MKMLLECFNHPVKITVSGFLVLLLTNTHNALISPHDLEEHLRSIAFNQTRSHHNPENKETTRDYIKSYWKRIALSNKDAVYISQTIPPPAAAAAASCTQLLLHTCRLLSGSFP
jgi:hypothetical protein